VVLRENGVVDGDVDRVARDRRDDVRMDPGQPDVGVLIAHDAVAVHSAEALFHLDRSVAIRPDDPIRQRKIGIEIDVDMLQPMIVRARREDEIRRARAAGARRLRGVDRELLLPLRRRAQTHVQVTKRARIRRQIGEDELHAARTLEIRFTMQGLAQERKRMQADFELDARRIRFQPRIRGFQAGEQESGGRRCRAARRDGREQQRRK